MWVDKANTFSSSTSWSNQPSVDGVHWYNGSWTGGAATCPQAGGWRTLDVRNLANNWTAGGLTYGNLALLAPDETNQDNFRKFSSSDSAWPPSVAVEYDPQNQYPAPSSATAVAGDQSATISWTPAVFAPELYGVSIYRSAGPDNWVWDRYQYLSGTTLSTTFPGLANGTSYIAQIACFGNGVWGRPVASNIFMPAPTPTAPTNIVANSGDSTATIRWSPSTNGPGADIGSYVVYAYNQQGQPLNHAVVTQPQTFATFGSQTTNNGQALTNGQPYYFNVTAINTSGRISSPSAFSNSVTPVASDPLAGAGLRSRFTTDSYSVSDTTGFSVNLGTGNLQVSATDLSLPSVGGGSLDIGRVYNSLSRATGASAPFSQLLGYGWKSNLSPDMRLVPLSSGNVQLHDSSGNVSLFVLSGGSFVHPPGVDADLVKQANGEYSLVYHASQQKLVFNPAGDLISSSDRNNNVVSFSYPDGRRPTTISSTGGSNPGNQTTITYNGPGGRLDKISQAATADTPARTVQYFYDAAGNGLNKVIDSEAGETLFFYDGSSRLSQITNPEGHVTQFEYDSAHRVTKVTQKIPSATDAVTIYDYTTAGHTRVTDPNGNPPVDYTVASNGAIIVATDAFGRLHETGWAGVNDRVASGRMGKTVSGSAEWDPNTTLGWMSDAERLSGVTDPMSAGGTLGYNDAQFGVNDPRHWLPANSTDSMGRVTSFNYDAKGNYLSSVLAGATSSVTVNTDGTAATSTTPSNQASGNRTIYDYFASGSGKGLLQKVTPPSGNSLAAETFTYDGNGRLKTSTSGKGVVTTYGYDKLDRVKSLTFTPPLLQPAIPTISFEYFKDGNLKTRTDGTGITTFTYDEAGRLKTKTPPGGPTMSYTYDPASNLVTSTDAGGTTTYRYNIANEMDKMTEPSGRTDLFAYNYLGLRSDTWYGTSGGGTYSGGALVPPTSFVAHIKNDYDMAGNLTHIQTAGKSIAGGGDGPLLSSLDHSLTIPGSNPCGYSPAPPSGGKMTSLRHSVTDNLTAKTTTWCYDPMGRLTSATAPGGPSYSYGWDANTNRVSDENGTHGFNSADQLTGTGYIYDADGNQTSSPSFPLVQYNGIDQTNSVTALGQTPLAMTYAGMGQSERTQAGSTTAQNGMMGVQTETAGGQTSSSIRDASGTLVYEHTPSGDFYYYFDGLGSVIGMMDATTGDQRAKYSYDPFGAHATAEGVNGALPSNPWRWMGGYLDSTGLYHFGERYYDPVIGRYSQIDPVEGGCANDYVYVYGDPINSSDTDGMQTRCADVKRHIDSRGASFRLRNLGPDPKNPRNEIWEWDVRNAGFNRGEVSSVAVFILGGGKYSDGSDKFGRTGQGVRYGAHTSISVGPGTKITSFGVIVYTSDKFLKFSFGGGSCIT